ncbi:prolipoprotein diacylglyceryl transferase family protein [Nostoc sp. FACHB-110]|uniref:prolipoprotein diacylglyceryl transferase n=1 Tax=Nostoc sp. FACHB-110 TaxID=2692834 RepID=UPI001686FD0B|nr:prolipoprotein diacylglyceryl transferase family protein [Nostoc sp. FACHB-110]MBD2436637.1 prolipoprotein diacylglyceryl transferase [Nostoc sp. FACHB-110]
MNFPVYFWLGSLRIHPHILFESLAYTVAFRLLLRNVKKDAIAPSQRSFVMLGGMVGALIGAKVLVGLQHIDLTWQNPQQLLLILVQGKTVVGALLGGLIGVEITKKIVGIRESTGDVFAIPLIVGTAIGRVGCFLTGLSDRTYGIATTLPWGIDFGDGILRHPTQLYEILFLICLIFLLKLRRRYQYQNGDLFKFYLLSYLSFRFLIDFIKPDFHPLFGISFIQLACLVTLIYYCRSIPQVFSYRKRTEVKNKN